MKLAPALTAVAGVLGLGLRLAAGDDVRPTTPRAPIRVLLLGDSTVIGTAARAVAPEADHLETIIRRLLAADTNRPPVEVLNQGQNGETIRRLLTARYQTTLAAIPPGMRALIPTNSIIHGNNICVLDNSLDVHFRDVPGWFGDRHPNLAGYHVIGAEIAQYLTPLIRKPGSRKD